MINQINQIAKLGEVLSQKGTTRFNSTLPMSIRVISKVGHLRYLLQIGNTEMPTRSTQDLQPGRQYWAQMGRSSVGSILISQLTPQPKLLQKTPSNVLLNLSDLQRFFNEESSKNSFDGFKSYLFEKMASSESRQEFQFLANMSMALQAGVFSLPLWYEDRMAFFQFRKKKLQGSKENSLEFYAAFSNIGPVKGLLVKHQEEIGLLLSLQYQSSLDLLREELKHLEGIDTVKLELLQNIEPFYEFSENILDLKG